MRIAVTSQNFRTVTGHAGRARRFIVFEADGQAPPREVERLDLDANMTIHGYDHEAAHPLDSINVLITGGAGEGFIRHLAARGVQVVATDENVPELAVAAFLAGRVKSASEACHHDHNDDSTNENTQADAEQSHECNCHC
jgi:predicted Fe-Mo cluster-binding NifX family protein